jgi:hypothetical protein
MSVMRAPEVPEIWAPLHPGHASMTGDEPFHAARPYPVTIVPADLVATGSG